MLKLQFKDRRREAVWLVDQCFSIGKDASNSLMIEDGRLEAIHAELVNRQDQLILVNKTQGAGVWVNGLPVGDEQAVKAGDEITLGDVELRLIDPKTASQQAAGVGSEASGWAITSKASWLEQSRYNIDGTLVIGRDQSCDVCIPLDHLSRRHLEISLRGGQLYAKDLNSSNGTFINGAKITESPLKSGDKIKLDVVTFDVVGPSHDPHKTIIRSAAPAGSASTGKTANQTKTAQGAAKAEKKSGSTSPPRPKKKKLVAEGKQDWIKAESGEQDASSSGSSAVIVIIGAVVIAAGLAAWMLL